MSSLISSIANNSNVQAMIVNMFNKINDATINAGQNKANDIKSISSEDFVKALENQFKKSASNVSDSVKIDITEGQIGMPAGMKISEDNSIIKESYQELLKSIMDNLDKNSDGTISQEEMTDFMNKISQSKNAETTGTLASSKAFYYLKNQAGTFIQKLIDKYKDNSDSILGISV